MGFLNDIFFLEAWGGHNCPAGDDFIVACSEYNLIAFLLYIFAVIDSNICFERSDRYICRFVKQHTITNIYYIIF